MKTPVFIVNSYNEGPIFGKLGCDIFGLMGSYNGIGSAMNNAAIAFDRHRYNVNLKQFLVVLNTTSYLARFRVRWMAN